MQILDAELPCPFELDEYADMDEDLKKVLKELVKSTGALVHQASTSQAPPTAPASQPASRPLATVAAIVTVVIVVLGAFWAILKYTISSELTAALIEPNKQIASLIDDVKYLRRDVDELRAEHSREAFREDSRASPHAIGQAAAVLKDQKVVIPRKEVSDSVTALLGAGATKENWDATEQVLSYVSFLNSRTELSFLALPPPHIFVNYTIPGWTGGRMGAVGESVAPNVPQLHPLNGPDKNKDLAVGPAYVILDGGTLKLDGLLLKNVVVRNAQVVYGGGSTSLEGVYFLNCTFSVAPQKTGELFAKAVASTDPKTDFSS